MSNHSLIDFKIAPEETSDGEREIRDLKKKEKKKAK
jgi:hypothetical protein